MGFSVAPLISSLATTYQASATPLGCAYHKLCLMAALFLLTYYLPIYLQSVKNASAMPNILGQLGAAILSGVLGESSLAPI